MSLPNAAAPDQVAQIKAATLVGVEGIVLGPIDPIGVIPGLNAAAAAGIPVVAIGAEPADGVVSAVVGDDEALAYAAGAYIAASLDGQGIVLDLQGDLANPAGEARARGLRAALARFAEIDVDARATAWDPDVAKTVAESAFVIAPPGHETAPPTPLTPDPDGPQPSAIFAASDAMAIAVAAAPVVAERPELVVVGFGGEPDTLAAVANGALDATVAELPGRTGAIAVDLLVRHLNGEPVPPRVDPGFLLVTDANVGAALAALPAATPMAGPDG